MNKFLGRKVVDESSEVIFQQIQKCKDYDDIECLSVNIVLTGIAILRGIKGVEFVEDLLNAAIDDKNPITITPKLSSRLQ